MMNLDVVQTHSYVKGYSYPTFSVRGGVGWGGVGLGGVGWGGWRS